MTISKFTFKSLLMLSVFGSVFISVVVRAEEITSMQTRFPLGSETPEMKFYTKGGDDIALSNYLGSKRIVLLFLPAAIAKDAASYLAKLQKSGNDLRMRDLKILAITDENSNLFESKFGTDIEVVFQKQLSSIGSAGVLRSEPLLILIGKDKTVKLSERHFVSKSALFAVIDSMPMRKDEKKRKQY